MQIYGCKISYYTGKLETYLRFRGIPYESLPTIGNEKKLIAGAGVVQMPVVQLDDGRWMTDTTPMLAWFESEQKAPTIYPKNPVLKFAARLIEDYADEWLWRAAMHYRWSYRSDRCYAAEAIYSDVIEGIRPYPRFLALPMVKRRQRGSFVRGDGVSDQTREHVELGYLTALDRLQAIFEIRPFVLGDTPTIADFGLMGPMLRHFGQDPTPAEIMRTRAPAVYQWVARMWNTRAESNGSWLIDEVDDVLADLLLEISETHLSQLRQNAQAYSSSLTRFDQDIQGCHYVQVPTSRYRVWALEELRRSWTAVGGPAQESLRAHLKSPEAAVLWDDTTFSPSDYDNERQAPFNRGINVYGTGLPPR
jgi:glutathione S-transferase